MKPASPAVLLRVGMTHGQARAAVSAASPLIELRLYRGTPAYFHDGAEHAEDAQTRDDEILRPAGHAYARRRAGRPFPPIRVTGATSSRERRDLIYAAFDLEPEFECPWALLTGLGDSLAEMQANASRWRAAFVERHGRPPAATDRFDGVDLPS